MKAFLLAAGLGTRLRPITFKTPKCLVPIKGKPLLGWWLDLLDYHRVKEILINLHYLPEMVIDFCKNYKAKVSIHFSYEKVLRGSAGTIKDSMNFVKGEKNFFVLYADNLTNINLSAFLEYHRKQIYNNSMALFRTPKPHSAGIVRLNRGNIVEFTEKPIIPISNLANAGVYIFSPDVIDYIPNNKVSDISTDLIPKLIGKLNGWETHDYLIDIGTIDNYKKANFEWKL